MALPLRFQFPDLPVAKYTVALTPEWYKRISRLVEHDIPVKLQFDIRAEFLQDDLDSVNIVGDIPGNDEI